VGKSRRHIDLSGAFVAQFDTKPSTKVGRLGPEIHDGIVDLSLKHSNDLRLGSPYLKVQAAQYAPTERVRMIFLNPIVSDPNLSVTLGSKDLQKETALIAEYARLDNKHAI
jgi:hypothetical protein